MNHDIDELVRGRTLSGRRTLLCLAATTLFVWPAFANSFRLGPIMDLSDPNALAPCGANGAEKECSVAVNPANPKNIVAAWIGGSFKDIVAAVSLDGGRKWQQVVLPELTVCAGANWSYDVAADPWLSFAPNGDLYLISGVSLLFQDFPVAMALSKSTDGGLHWSNPVTLFESADKLSVPEKPSITADPRNARFVYAVWNKLANGNRGQGMLSRTTDGGLTWETARVIYDPGIADSSTLNHLIVVLPDGTLVDFFSEYKFSTGGSRKDVLLSVIRSRDHGDTWSWPLRVATLTTFNVTDPDTGHAVANNSTFPPIAWATVDPHNGNLYAVWEDPRFSNGQYTSIAFTMSADGGFTWSAPIQVNKSPNNIAPANRQAFIPSVAVAADGTVAVTYYDFRFNDANPGTPTDYWLVHCHPTTPTACMNPANWSNELRLTEASFDIQQAPDFGVGLFIGDYQGLLSVGNDFLSAWSQPHGTDPDSIFFRRVGP